MNPVLDAVLLLVAFVLFLLAGIGSVLTYRNRPINLVALGLAFWVFTVLWPALRAA